MSELLRTMERRNGVFLRGELREAGYDDKAIARALRLKLFHRVRHGAYCFEDTWAGAGPEERHRILARAVMRVLKGKVVLSHVTALLFHGVAVWGADLSRVHVTRLDGGPGRIQDDIIHHGGEVRSEDVVTVAEIAVTSPTRAVLESGTVLPVESGLVSADSALHLGLTTPEDLERGRRAMERWPGAQRLHIVVPMANGGAQSVGESRSRHFFRGQHIPEPELQHRVYDARGRLIGILDFYWEELRALGEFDGRVKYGRLLKPGQDPGDVVFAEKQREDSLRRETGLTVVRLVWQDLDTPVQTGRWVRRQLGLGP